MGLFYDSTYLLVILAALISMAVSVRMNTIFSKYQTVRSYSGMTGREAASGRHLRCDRPPRIR